MNAPANQLTLPMFLDLPVDARATLSTDKVKVIYAPGADCVTIAGCWTRLTDGSIEAVYSIEELELCEALLAE